MAVKLPRKLKVGYVDYRIIPTTPEVEKAGAIGFQSPLQHVLMIKPGLIPAETANTLLHETVHAILEHAGVLQDDDEFEECVVLAVTNGLCQVIKDNPDFLPAIVKGLRG
jgi:hypothetical protein